MNDILLVTSSEAFLESNIIWRVSNNPLDNKPALVSGRAYNTYSTYRKVMHYQAIPYKIDNNS